MADTDHIGREISATLNGQSGAPEPKPVPQNPDERPIPGPRGPRTPYPVDRPDIENLPGAEPDVVQPVTPPVPGRM